MPNIWWFEFIDCDKVGALNSDDLILCSENIQNIDPNSFDILNTDIIGTSKNEAIDSMIKKLQEMKDD